MSRHSGRLVTDAVIAVLEDAGLVVGDAEKPKTDPCGWAGAPGKSNFVPYVVVYPLAGGTIDGTLDGPHEDAWPLYQLTSVGATRAQAEWTADVARDALLANTLAVTGRRITHVQIDELAGARRDDLDQPPVWYSPDRYSIATVPASTLTPNS